MSHARWKKVTRFKGSVFGASVITSWFTAASAWAVCPVCTVAVGAGVGLSRYLGVDDTVAGAWIGALTVSVILWTNNWMEKRGWRFRFRDAIVALTYVVLVIAPLYWSEIVGHPFNTLGGVDKLMLGIGVGGAVFYGVARWYEYLKAKNGGRSYFPFQKVVMPVVALAVVSLFFYVITK